jgi:hypothetical protein
MHQPQLLFGCFSSRVKGWRCRQMKGRQWLLLLDK